MRNHPQIIQGGMGAGVSNWRLARAVSKQGQLGVVSGVALDIILARRLQDGDPGGHMRLALEHFPFRKVAEKILKKYYIPGGKGENKPYWYVPVHSKTNEREVTELCIAGNFVEVFLARQGHDNPVGINFLEKIQMPHLSSIYGAMLAGVGYILMGAGIPVKIPGVLDNFAKHEPATYPLYVAGAQEGDDTTMTLAPREFMECDLPPLHRPVFLAIVASNTLAITLVRKSNGRVDGFIVEGPTAGGHNAPPRGKLQLNEIGEPIYGERDQVDLQKMCELGLPFWLAGGYGSAEKLQEALSAGAAGVQVGTPFAFCAESGLRDDYKQSILDQVACGKVQVFTDRLASPTGFPFKCVLLKGTGSDAEEYKVRSRVCDVGQLREAYRTPEGKIDYRCASEPVAAYIKKGGKVEDTVDRKCLCNALLANIGYPQVRGEKYRELGLVTAGDVLVDLARFLPSDSTAYTAADVIGKLLNSEKSEKEEKPIEVTTCNDPLTPADC